MPGSHKKVLVYIALEGPKTKYDIEKGTKINHASIFQAVKNFLDSGALEGEVIGTTRTGLPKTNFGLTFLGLVMALQITDIRNYKKIIHKWRNLEPILFGRWNYFEEIVGRKETEEFFYKSVRFASIRSSKPEDIMEDFRADAVVGHFAKFREEIFDVDPEVFPEFGYEQSNRKQRRQKYTHIFEKWIDAFRADSQLMEYVRGIIMDEGRHAIVMKRWVDFLKQKFPSQPEIKKGEKMDE